MAAELPCNFVTAVDGINLVQRAKGDHPTFGVVARSVMSMTLGYGSQSLRTGVVFDMYQDVSIKNSDRSVRASHSVIFVILF